MRLSLVSDIADPRPHPSQEGASSALSRLALVIALGIEQRMDMVERLFQMDEVHGYRFGARGRGFVARSLEQLQREIVAVRLDIRVDLVPIAPAAPPCGKAL